MAQSLHDHTTQAMQSEAAQDQAQLGPEAWQFYAICRTQLCRYGLYQPCPLTTLTDCCHFEGPRQLAGRGELLPLCRQPSAQATAAEHAFQPSRAQGARR